MSSIRQPRLSDVERIANGSQPKLEELAENQRAIAKAIVEIGRALKDLIETHNNTKKW